MFPFAALSENLGASLFALILLFLLFLAAFARKRTGWVLLGFLRVVGALFAEPVRYLDRIIRQYGGVGEKGLGSVEGTHRGLLATFLFYLQVGLAVGALGILSVGTIVAWKALMPPTWAQVQLDSARKTVDTDRQNLEAAREKLKALEGGMAQKKAESVNLFKSLRQKTLQDSATNMANAEKAVKGNPSGADALAKIKVFLSDKSTPATTWEVNDPKEKVEQFITNNVAADDATKATLLTYSNAWYQKMVAQVELATFDEAQIARQLEGERAALANDITSKEGELKYESANLEELKEAASYRFGGAIGALLLAIGQFLAFIWVSGLLLEVMELALRHAFNVQEIRDSLKAEPEEDAVAPEATGTAVS